MNSTNRIKKILFIAKYMVLNPSELSINNFKKFRTIKKSHGFVEALKKTYTYSNNRTSTTNKQTEIDLPITDLNSMKKLTIPRYTEIEVSIIIPAYNQIKYTYNCISSIIETTEEIKYEIILADDCSTDETMNIASYVENLRIVRPKHNLRFTLNCNNAAKHAKGKYIVFLNNDTIVKEKWLFWLKKVLDEKPNVGLVGSKLIFPDGMLQEAGGIIWSDGSGWNYGRGQNPDLPEFNYLKEADYISGASIMVRKELWERIGGFDERYAPSYCEDSDLCFEVRKHGYKVLYQPFSELIHFEGISNGTSTNSGLKAYQVENSKKLFDKWRVTFEKEQNLPGIDVFKARDRSMGKKTIIIFDETVPTFDKDAGSRTIFDTIEILVNQGYNVKMMTHNFYHDPEYSKIYQQMGVEILYGYEMYTGWKEWFKENHAYIDYAFICRPDVAEFFLNEIKKYSHIKVIYNLMDLHYLRLEREYELSRKQETLKKARASKEKELKIMRNADVVLTVSAYELKVINEIAPDINIKFSPGFYYRKTNYSRIFSGDGPSIMFVGGFNHTPNQDAVKWFLEKIWPIILNKIPNCVFYIIGSNPTIEIKKMQKNNVIVTGYVSQEEMDHYYDKCMAAVVPLRYGAGVKGKVIDALYHKIPLISTSVGLEGLPSIQEYVIAYDDEQSFANAVTTVLVNHEKSDESAMKYSNYIEKYYSEKNTIELFNDILK